MRRLSASLVAAFALALPVPALACGGMVSEDGSAELLGFEALLRWNRGAEELLTEVSYTSAGRDFGWMMPLPAPPEVSEADSGLIEAASEVTEPPKKEDIVPDLIPVDEGEGGVTGGAPGVDVIGRQTVGGLRFVTLGGEEAGEVAAWMADHGFEFHDRQEPVLQRYLDRGWVLVAARVAPGEILTGSIVPVSFRFDSPEPVYPLAMAGTGHEEQDLDVRLFVLTPYRPASATYRQRVVRPDPDGHFFGVGRRLELRYSAPLGADASLFGAEPSTWLSRYEGDLRSEGLTDDLVFGRAPEQSPLDYRDILAGLRTQRMWIYVQRVAYPLLLLGVIVGLTLWFVRRPRWLGPTRDVEPQI